MSKVKHNYLACVFLNNFPLDGFECVLHHCMRWCLFIFFWLAVLWWPVTALIPFMFWPMTVGLMVAGLAFWMVTLATKAYESHSAWPLYVELFKPTPVREKKRELLDDRLREDSEVNDLQTREERDCSLVGVG